MTDSSILVVTVMLASTLLARPLEPIAAQETTVDETAEALDVSPRTVDSDWSFARAWLYRELGSGDA